jgi:hypothetical protein
MPLNPAGRHVQPPVKRLAPHTEPLGRRAQLETPHPVPKPAAAIFENLRPCGAPRNSRSAIGGAANGQPHAAPVLQRPAWPRNYLADRRPTGLVE